MNGFEPASAFAADVRVDLLTCVMLLLVGGVGLVIAHYSRRYLHGDPGAGRYFRWLTLTLGAVACVVLANNLLVIAIAWLGASLALHQLLTFYPDRPAALVAAHKKFLVSRLADLSMGACLLLVQREVGSLDLDRIEDWVSAHPALTPAMQAAAVLVVMAAVLRSAQLPFHGWLMQVMEAPTPVSALLHAGVVNMGGFVLIRLSPWIGRAPAAQGTLIVVGLLTAVVAALVTTTRVSVKVALAWSTCAQMGFMLLECGLGAFHLALLHLFAHSLYKAHAFLSAGGVVERWSRGGARPPVSRPSLLALAVTLGAAFAVFAAVARMMEDVSLAVLGLVLTLSLGPALARPGGARSAITIAVLYAVAHFGASRLAPAAPASAFAWLAAGAGLTMLFALKTALAWRPDGPFARALYPWLFAGFYLDEWFTRLAFRVWPPQLGRAQGSSSRPASHDAVTALEA